MIEFSRVTVTYPDATRPVLSDVSLLVEEGELCLVAGPTGAGKSTLLGAINGLVPHFTGGRLSGRVVVGGFDTASHPPRELASVVGVVGQDPLSGFVTDTVEEELAYAMEQLAVPPDVMRKRVEETLDLLGIADLRNRPLRTLSGGQQQRVAIGSVLTAHPSVVVLDEPTSALDPTAAEDVLAAITRLVHDLGTTVIVAEHRMERVAQYADRLLYLPGDGSVRSGPPAEIFETSAIAPPIAELGRLAGWSPLPLSVRDARRLAGPLRSRLQKLSVVGRSLSVTGSALDVREVVVRYGDVLAVRGVDLRVGPGEVVALMGRNGSGKSSLLWAVQGSGPRSAGKVDVGGADPASLKPRVARQRVGLVPQTPADLLYLDSVDAECAQADTESEVPAGTARDLLDRLTPGIAGEAHPGDLSEGQRLSLVLAIQLASAPPVVLLDEPTRGLDYHAKRRFAAALRELASQGHAIVLATHDVEFVATVASRVVVMAEGEVVADGPTKEVVVASPAFAPQVAKILAPERWLTVDEVAEALA
ncbi:ABC transporter ATP-binding protein [Amycolatopsis sp.]|uniref:ABC transporter ATP-binding protein n=1 Tax=Amycolatopsis sp. TaxID=37632 RepID=UPI002D80DD1A|nr:ATP-binding cassette domain-containing protein [Amycolatopsis sp.]HET6709227.1 ATP-binding cassette domain-containing protein [Amycolatopsis sp.]